MTGAVSRETRVQRTAAARTYAGLDEAAWRRRTRRFHRKVDPVEFALAWRDDVPAKAIADRFDLAHEGYVTAVRRRLGLPCREPGGRRRGGAQ